VNGCFSFRNIEKWQAFSNDNPFSFGLALRATELPAEMIRADDLQETVDCRTDLRFVYPDSKGFGS